MPGGVTKVIVVHENFQGQTATSTGLQGGGWTWILSNMKTLLETGEPMPQGYEPISVSDSVSQLSRARWDPVLAPT